MYIPKERYYQEESERKVHILRIIFLFFVHSTLAFWFTEYFHILFHGERHMLLRITIFPFEFFLTKIMN